jgi:hypothetical protein
MSRHKHRIAVEQIPDHSTEETGLAASHITNNANEFALLYLQV